jgi:nucleotide-binding universal stress UspA family protein
MIDYQTASQDFDKARNKALWQTVMGHLTGQNIDLIQYDEVRKRLAKTINKPTELREIPIKDIVGTLSRGTDFSRTFLPRFEFDKNRWVRVMVANQNDRGFPPIDVYQIGSVYFVIDGHHRVSVLKSVGAKFVTANVRVINPNVPINSDDSLEEIILKTERQSFLDLTKLETTVPEADILFSQPESYQQLYEHISVHRYLMGVDLNRPIPFDEALKHWYECLYLPVIRVFRSMKIMKAFPDKTEADLFLWFENNQAKLKEEYGDHLRLSSLVWRFDEQFGRNSRNFLRKLKRTIALLFSSNMSDWGIQTGQWRQELIEADASPVLGRMMITVKDFQRDQDYLRSAIRFSKQFQAWLGIVHVLKQNQIVDDEWMDKNQQMIDSMLQEENVKGKLFYLRGKLLRNLSERAFWSDISIFRMNYRPSPLGAKSLSAGWNSIFVRIPGPILVTNELLPEKITNIVVGYASTAKSREALYFAFHLSRVNQAKITLVIAGESEENRAKARRDLFMLNQNAEREMEIIEINEPVERALTETAQQHNAELIVIGGYTQSLFKRFFMKSTIEKVLSITTIPVIICK